MLLRWVRAYLSMFRGVPAEFSVGEPFAQILLVCVYAVYLCRCPNNMRVCKFLLLVHTLGPQHFLSPSSWLCIVYFCFFVLCYFFCIRSCALVFSYFASLFTCVCVFPWHFTLKTDRSHRADAAAIWCRRVGGLVLWGFVGMIFVRLWLGKVT